MVVDGLHVATAATIEPTAHDRRCSCRSTLSKSTMAAEREQGGVGLTEVLEASQEVMCGPACSPAEAFRT